MEIIQLNSHKSKAATLALNKQKFNVALLQEPYTIKNNLSLIDVRFKKYIFNKDNNKTRSRAGIIADETVEPWLVEEYTDEDCVVIAVQLDKSVEKNENQNRVDGAEDGDVGPVQGPADPVAGVEVEVEADLAGPVQGDRSPTTQLSPSPPVEVEAGENRVEDRFDQRAQKSKNKNREGPKKPKNKNKTVYLASIYLDSNLTVEKETMIKLVEKCENNKIPLIMGLDCNAHSNLWGCEKNNPRGDELELIILTHELYI